MSPVDLVGPFLAPMPEGVAARARLEPPLAGALAQALEEARATGFVPPAAEAAFLSFLGERAAAGETAATEALSRLRIPDLAVAFGCLHGHPAALVTFDAMVSSAADVLRKRSGGETVDIDEILQRVRTRLLVPVEEAALPKLATYGGHGELRAWLRVAATRTMLNIQSRESRERPVSDVVFDGLVDEAASPELRYLKKACAEELREALGATLEAMSTDDRLLLGYAFVDGLTVDRLGQLYGVHRATAARSVQRARQAFVASLERELTTRLAVSRADAMSVLRAALSQIDTTLARRLKEPG